MVQQFYSWMCIRKKKKIVRQKGFFNGSAGKESACNAGDTGDMGQIPGTGRSPGVGNKNSLARKFHGQKSLADYGPLDHESQT